jgi:ATP-binding cassette subfamily F protein 3
MIAVNNITVEFSAKRLLDDITYVINDKDKIALVGRNGAGKSTMLKIIAGIQKPTSGTVAIPKDAVIGYLPQQMRFTDVNTLREEVREAFSSVTKMNEEIADINRQLVSRTDYESTGYQALIDRVSHLTELVAMSGSENFDAQIEKTLLGLGFERTDFDRLTSEFSGGWRMRVELAKLLLRRPDVMLLDEPTNHLDIESIQWLENFLKASSCSLLLVSHDRAFIDNVTNRTIEISLGHIYDYSVNYSHFVELRKERVEQQMRAYQNQQKMIADTEAFIERFRYKPTKSVQVQSRIKQLAKIQRIEVDEVDNAHLSLKFPPAPRSGDYPVIADEVGKRYGNLQVFSGATFTIKRGEKVAFVGKNGAGKSTLVKCIMNEIPFDGTLKIGHNVQIGYFAQNQAQLLDGEITVFDTIDRVAVGDIRTKIRDILGAFLFGGEDIDKKVKVLSGGEKTRLAMIRLLLEPVNLLILDEPTNHLDMRTKDILKDAIRDFNGTAIIVSHDREFLDGLVSKVYEFGGGKVKEHLGGIYDFLQEKKIESLSELERTQPVAASQNEPKPSAQQPNSQSAAAQAEPEPPKAGSKLSYMEQKEHDKLIRKAERKVADCEAEIAKYEAEIAQIEQQLAAGGDIDPAIYTRHADIQKHLDNAMSLWELAGEELESLK